MDRETQTTRARVFREMHFAPGPLLLPNAWDAGSAMIFVREGFKAIATTSSGVEFSANLSREHELRFDQMLEAIRGIIRAIDVPMTADMEAGYGKTPAEVEEKMVRAIATGIVGVNIEDSTGGLEVAMRERGPLTQYSIGDACERLAATRRASTTAGVQIVINARTDAFIIGGRGKEALDDAITRGNAYLEAGADCVFVPYATEETEIATLVLNQAITRSRNCTTEN
jgi:2-methylisocitrate lyase-like PEP mutase family enzyme